MKNLEAMYAKLEELRAKLEVQEDANFDENFGKAGYVMHTPEISETMAQIEAVEKEIDSSVGEINLRQELKNLKNELEEMQVEYDSCVSLDAEHGAYLASEEIKTLESKIEWTSKRIKERA